MRDSIEVLEKKYLGDVAVVGTPCQINAIRKMQLLGILPAHIVRYAIGVFCTESFRFDDLARESLEKKLDFNLEDISKLNIKEDFIVTLKNGLTFHVPLNELDEVARSACFACNDFTNEYADISVGGLGSPDGYTTTLIRTDLGTNLYSEALREGYIEERLFKDSEERKTAKTLMLAKVVSFARRKRMRAEKTFRKLHEAKPSAKEDR